jgi:hypothetical protein
MKSKIGIIKSENFNPENYSEVVRGAFTEVTYEDITYMQLHAFEHYFNEHFDKIFDTQEAYEKWLKFGGIEAWHDESQSIQIVLTLEQNTDLVTNVPEIAMYRKQNNIIVHRDEKFVYSYVNWLLEEHESLLLSYGAVINRVE